MALRLGGISRLAPAGAAAAGLKRTQPWSEKAGTAGLFRCAR
jgi:hypothetical protein